jgi:hypothetical protein
MTHLINKTRIDVNKIRTIMIVLLAISYLSCKNSPDKEENIAVIEKSEMIDSILISQNKPTTIQKKNSKERWVFHKVVPISNSYSCDSKMYKDFKFSVVNDSVFIDNKYTDDVFSGEIKSEAFFKKENLYSLYKEFLPKNFNVNLPQSIKYIRNKKAYQSDSKLDTFFQDAFFIDEFIFFKKEGCLYCFKKEAANKTNEDNCIGSKNNSSQLPYKINHKDFRKFEIANCDLKGGEEFLCDKKKLRYIPLPDFKNIQVILVPQDCGDFPYRFFLLTILNNQIISNHYVEGEWNEPEDESYKEITSFSIDPSYKLEIITNSIENGKSSLKETLTFQVTESGVLKKIKTLK